MCGRYILLASYEEVFEALHVEYSEKDGDQWRPRFNLAPTQDAPLFMLGKEGRRELRWLKWGLIPSFAQDPSIASRMINARSETVQEKPAFRDSFERRRCVVVSNGFFEWKREGKLKQPHWIRRKDRGLILMAGIWDSWRSPFGETKDTFAILTKDASPFIRELHDRMPLMIGVENLEPWLTNKNLDHLISDHLLEVGLVSAKLNSPKVDDESVLLPPDMNPLGQLKLL